MKKIFGYLVLIGIVLYPILDFIFIIYKKRHYVEVTATYSHTYDPKTGEARTMKRGEDKAFVYSYTYEGKHYLRRERHPFTTKKSVPYNKKVKIYVNPHFPFLFMSHAYYKRSLFAKPIEIILITACVILGVCSGIAS